MKCDVCLTNIPLNAHECPNCGYKMKESRVQSFDASGKTHEHIRAPQIKKSKIKTTKEKRLTTIIVSFILVITMLSLFVGSVIIPMLSGNIFDDDSSYTTYEDMTFAEMIDEGIDRDGVIQETMEYASEIKALYKQLGMTDISENEYCSVYEQQVRTNYFINGYHQDICYRVEVSLSHEEGLSQTGLTISYDSKESMQEGKMPFSKDIVEQLGKLIQLENVYNIFDDSRKKMKQDKDNEKRYVYSDYDHHSLYLSEDQHTSGYFHYYSLQSKEFSK